MERNILNEVNRMREIMGLKLILEQNDESWKSVAGGKPYDLIFNTPIKDNDFYFASRPTILYLENWPSEDVVLDFKSIAEYRVPKNVVDNYTSKSESTTKRVKQFIEWTKRSEPKIFDDKYYYIGPSRGGMIAWPTDIYKKIEKNTNYSEVKFKMCAGKKIWDYVDKHKIWSLNELRDIAPAQDFKKTGIVQYGTNLFGEFLPGCTNEIKTKFMQYIDNWIQSNADGKYSKSTLYGKIKQNGIVLGLDKASIDKTSTPGEEGTEEEVNDAVAITPKISGVEGEPFVNNSFELSESTLSVIKEIKQFIQQVLQDNPGTYAIAADKLIINEKKTDIPYTISTSASRLTNGGQAKDWTFLELSQKRANRTAQVMSQTIGPLLQGGLPNPVLNFKGENGDGSSGPNPTSPNNVSTDGKESTKYQNGSEDANKHRNDYGTAKPKEQLEEYKYCIIQLGIKFVYYEDEESPGDDTSTYPDEVTIGEWIFTIVPGDRPKKSKNKFKININWNFGGGGGGGGLFGGGGILPCPAYD